MELFPRLMLIELTAKAPRHLARSACESFAGNVQTGDELLTAWEMVSGLPEVHREQPGAQKTTQAGAPHGRTG
jgi:hypothetical protein